MGALHALYDQDRPLLRDWNCSLFEQFRVRTRTHKDDGVTIKSVDEQEVASFNRFRS